MSDIIKTQRSLAVKATHQSHHQFDHLYRIICQEEWIRAALDAVLSNKGARTAGIDGVTKKAFTSDETRDAFARDLRELLRTGRFRPVPVRRVYIPKANGKRRPLGIPVLRDRVVQMLLKMVLEPIWESDFLACSNGFRPRRRTMDCIARLDSYINRSNKFYWVIEGDIRGAFDNIHHEVLLRLLAERIADRRILALVARFLKAGVMEGGLVQRTDLGTPQGGICSPLLANVYLHQLDLFWWRKYGGLDQRDKERRRRAHRGNCGLIRYADDWLLLTNGSKAEAYRLRDELQRFLAEELKLELAIEKTRVTHVNDGFDFLGFHVRRRVAGNDRPKVLVTPSPAALARLKVKVKQMTDRKRFREQPLLKISALNAVLRGWIGYYRHCNAKEIAKDLDFWVNRRLFRWLQERHRLRSGRIVALYKHRQEGRRYNLGVQNGEAMRFLYCLSDQPLRKYRSRTIGNPYLDKEWVTEIEAAESAISEPIWLGNAERHGEWQGLKAAIKAERGAQCEACGSRRRLHLHHLKARRIGGPATTDNVRLLCVPCHVRTPSYGDRRRLQ
jgi:group II intron reverse transcriptase/maturase